MAPATFAATAATEDFFRCGNLAAFERLGDKAVHQVADALEHLLRFLEGANAFMGIDPHLQDFESLDISVWNGDAAAVALLEAAAQSDDFAVEIHGGLIGKKGFSLFTGGYHLGIRSDSGAEIVQFGFNGGQG